MSDGRWQTGQPISSLPYAMGQSAVGGVQRVIGGGMKAAADHPWLAAMAGPAMAGLTLIPGNRRAMGDTADSALDAGAANQRNALQGRGMAGRFAVNAAGSAPELAAILASGPYAPLTAAGIAGADKYGEVRNERGLSPDEALKAGGVSAGFNAVIGMIPGLKGLAGPEYESLLRGLGRQGVVGGAMGEAQGVANTSQNALEFGDQMKPEPMAAKIGNWTGLDPRTVQMAGDFLQNAAGGVPGGWLGGALRGRLHRDPEKPSTGELGMPALAAPPVLRSSPSASGENQRLGQGRIGLIEGQPGQTIPRSSIASESDSSYTSDGLIFDRQGNAHIRLGDSKLLDSIDAATTQREDGSGYAVVHPQSRTVLGAGATPEQAQAHAEEMAGKLGRRRLQTRLDEGDISSQSDVPSSNAADHLAVPAGEGVAKPQPMLTHIPTTYTLDQIRRMSVPRRWKAAELLLQEWHNSPGQSRFNVPAGGEITGSGGRVVDAPVQTSSGGVLANEAKMYKKWITINGQPTQQEVPLHSEIKQQVLKDSWLKSNVPGYDPRWHFFDAPPSPELDQILSDNGITYVIYK
jgi:hypothetical protein